MNIVKDYGSHFLRDDTEIRTGVSIFEGEEEAYSLFQRNPYRRIHVYAGPKEWAIKEVDAMIRPHVSIGGPYVAIEVYNELLAKYEALEKEFGEIYTSMKTQTEIDFSLDIIYEVIDELLLAEKFESVDNICNDFAKNCETLEYILAVLTVTLPAKSKLPHRAILLWAAKQRFSDAPESVWSGL